MRLLRQFICYIVIYRQIYNRQLNIRIAEYGRFLQYAKAKSKEVVMLFGGLGEKSLILNFRQKKFAGLY
jgi:hypothetical protein